MIDFSFILSVSLDFLSPLGLQVRKSHGLHAYINVIHRGAKPEKDGDGRGLLGHIGVEGLKIKYCSIECQEMKLEQWGYVSVRIALGMHTVCLPTGMRSDKTINSRLYKGDYIYFSEDQQPIKAC